MGQSTMATVQWKQNMLLEGEVSSHKVMMDAKPPFGKHEHPTPKELLLISMAGCTTMDVIGLLKKQKQNFTDLKVTSEGDAVATQPQVFQKAVLQFYVSGNVEVEILKEAIHLSLSKYCSVNAMLSKLVPISWIAHLNGEIVGRGEAQFNL